MLYYLFKFIIPLLIGVITYAFLPEEENLSLVLGSVLFSNWLISFFYDSKRSKEFKQEMDALNSKNDKTKHELHIDYGVKLCNILADLIGSTSFPIYSKIIAELEKNMLLCSKCCSENLDKEQFQNYYGAIASWRGSARLNVDSGTIDTNELQNLLTLVEKYMMSLKFK